MDRLAPRKPRTSGRKAPQKKQGCLALPFDAFFSECAYVNSAFCQPAISTGQIHDGQFAEMSLGLCLGLNPRFPTKKIRYLLFEVYKVKTLDEVTIRLRQPRILQLGKRWRLRGFIFWKLNPALFWPACSMGVPICTSSRMIFTKNPTCL